MSKLKIASLVLLAALFMVLVNRYGLLTRALEWIAALGPWGPIAFILVYVVATILLIPGTILTLGAGFLFGVFQGVLVSLTGATLGAGAAFLTGRYLARDWVATKLAANPRFAAIDEAVGREGWKIVLLSRLSPLFPFNLLNYLFGLTRVRFWSYLLASAVGMAPGSLLYVYIGSLAGDLAALGDSKSRSPLQWAFLGVGLLATLAVTVYVTRLARRSLDKHAPVCFDSD